MYEFKTREKQTLKTNDFALKGGSKSKEKIESFNPKKRDIVSYHGKLKIKKDIRRVGHFVNNRVEGVLKGNDNLEADISTFDKTSKTALVKTKNVSGKVVLKAGSFVISKGATSVEKKVFRDKINNEIHTKTAFSPLKIRRTMYNKEYRKEMKAKRTVQIKKNVDKVRKAASVSGKGATFAIRKTLNIAGALSRLAISAIIATIASVGLVLLPLIGALIITYMLVSAIILNQQSGDLMAVYATGVINGNSISINIFSEEQKKPNKPLYTFTTNITSNDVFIYENESKKKNARIKGQIRFNKIKISGKIKSKGIAMEGTAAAGLVKMEGFYGNYAEAALAGDWQNPFGNIKYVITSAYGYRMHPVSGQYQNHDGYDICAVTGRNTPVRASASGTVVLAGVYGGYGNCVVISHTSGVQSLYGHLSKVLTTEGKRVKVGEKIGLEGNSGVSTGTHLHFEIRNKGKAVDGADFLKTIYINATNGKEWQQ